MPKPKYFTAVPTDPVDSVFRFDGKYFYYIGTFKFPDVVRGMLNSSVTTEDVYYVARVSTYNLGDGPLDKKYVINDLENTVISFDKRSGNFLPHSENF